MSNNDYNEFTGWPSDKLLVGKIKTQEEAIKSIIGVTNVILLLSVLEFGMGFWFMNPIPAMVVFSIVIFFTFWLRKSNNRFIAIILFLLSLTSLITGVRGFTGSDGPYAEPTMAFVMTLLSIRGIYATFKLHKIQRGGAAKFSKAI